MRKTLSILFAIVATLTLFLAVLNNPSSMEFSVNETIANSRKIEQRLIKASNFVEGFKHENKRLPTETEFVDWEKSHATNGYSQGEMFIETNLANITSRLDNPNDVQSKDFGAPPDGSYIIELWRGEWLEYYISWHGETTLELNPKTYYSFGSALRDFIFLIFLFLIFTATSIWFWLNSKKALKAIHNG